MSYTVVWYDANGEHETARMSESAAYSTREHVRANGITGAVVLAYFGQPVK